MTDVAELINRTRYPITEPGSRGACSTGCNACAHRCREPAPRRRPIFCPRLVSSVALPMPNRWHRNSTKALVRERPISKSPIRSGPPIIRARLGRRYSVGVVAYDQFPATSPVRRLYEWRPVIDFVSAVLERAPLYQYADPMGALNLAVMGDGDELQWHYDQTDFVVSLALRDADVGGDFEVAPKLRSASDENYAGVSRVLAGDSDEVTRLPMTPGTLLIFAGRHSLHRVSPISGCDRTARCVARLRHAPGHAQHAASAAQALRKSARLTLELREHVAFHRARRRSTSAATATRASHRHTPARRPAAST